MFRPMAPRAAYGFNNPNAGKPANGDRAAWGGYAWPNCPPASLQGMTDYTTRYGQRLRVQVRKELIELLTLVFKITEKHDYVVYARKDGVNWGPWGSECRPISNTQTPSGHSIAVSVDMNAPNNGYSTTWQCDMPPAMVADIEACGWYWGGRYTGKYDPMHYGYCWTPGDVARHTAKALSILGQPNTGGEPPKPDPEDDSMSAADVNSLMAYIDRKFKDAETLNWVKGITGDGPGQHANELLAKASEAVNRPQLDDVARWIENAGMGGGLQCIRADDDKAGHIFGYNVATGRFIWLSPESYAVGLSLGFLSTDVQVVNRRAVDVVWLTSNQEDCPYPSSMMEKPPGPATYIVVSGDTFSGIAKKLGVTVDALKAANPQVTDINYIDPGQVLNVPK